MALGALLALSLISCGPVTTLFLQGGQRQLKANMHPTSQSLRTSEGPRMIIFAFDGVGYDQFMATVHSGKAPRMQALLGTQKSRDLFEHAYSVPDAVDVLPTTLPGWTATFTGFPPAWNGVTGDEFFIREQMNFYAPVPVSVDNPDDALRMLSANLLGKVIETPTVFEQLGLRSYVSLNGVYRGADVFTGLDRGAYAGMLAAVAKGLVPGTSVDREVFADVDEDSVSALIENIDKHGFADLQVVYFPGIDLYTHRAKNPLESQVSFLEDFTDKNVGEVLDYYQKRQVLDQTYILFVADHGHTPVLDDNRHALGSDENHDLPTLIQKTGFRVRPFALDAPDQDYQALLAYQGVMAYIYLADRSTCGAKGARCDWQKPPRLAKDVMPVVRALYHANQTGNPVSGLKGTLDLIFARKPVTPGHKTDTFEIFNGTKLVPIYQYLSRHSRPDLVQLDKRMSWLSAGPYGDRTGDIVVLPRFTNVPIQNRFYFGPPYHSEHGSPSMQDSHIPFVLACTTASGEHLHTLVKRTVNREPSQLDVVPLILRLLKPSKQLSKQ
jgi:type I phosphodiesterase/nucleotide pyrophosphatase